MADPIPAGTMTLMDHLPALPVLAPLLAAPLIAVIGVRHLAWPIAFATVLISFITSVMLMFQVSDGSEISYAMGGWAPPFGIEYRIDAANALVLSLISGIAVLIMPYCLGSLKHHISEKHHTLVYSTFLLAIMGLMGITITGDAFNIFVFLEISSLSTYALIAMGAERDRRALTAAYDYLIMGTIGATFLVIGIGFLYMSTGTLNLGDMADRIAGQSDNRTVQAAFAFIIIGLGLKVAIYPLHHWLPNAYTHAPTAITAFLAATATKAAVYVIMRFVFSVFVPAFEFVEHTLTWIFIPFALLAMFAASFIAIFQNNFKRMLAYSSIAQIGYMLLGIALLNASGVAATFVHLVNHGVTKAALFMGVGLLLLHSKTSFYDQIAGMGRRMPITGFLIVIAGLSLIGIPGTAGFISKWQLVQAAFEADLWWIAFLIVASSLLAVVYVWRVIETLYLAEGPEGRLDEPLTMVIPAAIMAAVCIWFGFDTRFTLDIAQTAAEVLLSGPFSLTGGEG
ncbi:MAG: monovalent cation/H+ antiporter subunit D family protein [Pseudomonadota bacterium]